MQIIDYNGSGRWTFEAILHRYAEYARGFHCEMPLDLTPEQHENGDKRWIYPVMNQVIRGIEAGDAACIQIGVEFIEEDAKFPFGKTLKANTARALRRAPLTPEQIARIGSRVISMLVAGDIPHEFREYAKLLRKVGTGEQWSAIHKRIERSNPFVMRFYNYLNAPREMWLITRRAPYQCAFKEIRIRGDPLRGVKRLRNPFSQSFKDCFAWLARGLPESFHQEL